MDKTIVIQLLILAGSTIGAIASILNGRRIQKVRIDIDGNLQQLIKAKESLAHSEGMAAQRADDAAEQKANGGLPKP